MLKQPSQVVLWDQTFLNGANAPFVLEMYERYLDNPSSVDAAWVNFFAQHQDSLKPGDLRGASWSGRGAQIIGLPDPDIKPVSGKAPTAAPAAEAVPAAAVQALIAAYQNYGHLAVQLDPLHLATPLGHPALDPAFHGIDSGALNKTITLPASLGGGSATVSHLLDTLRRTYSATIGVETDYLQNNNERTWLQQRLWQRAEQSLGQEEQKTILRDLIRAEGLENFLATKFQGVKRFGLEGGDALIPGLQALVNDAAAAGCEEIIFGMAHRGRLNVLTNIVGKPNPALLAEFLGKYGVPEGVPGAGDVKYHMGYSSDMTIAGRTLHLSLAYNPSHLESVDPVVVGKVRAKQQLRGDSTRRKVFGVLIHGDAAVAGQGVVPETLLLMALPGYTVGGTIHFVINNQVGFTTSAALARSGPYCTDVAKMVQAPVLHVNGDDPEAVVWAARTALAYRQEFSKDVFVDIVCFRKNGHNETDEPAFTQPVMYKAIEQHPGARSIYAQRLLARGTLSEAEAEALVTQNQQRLEADLESAKTYKVNKADWLEGAWAQLTYIADDTKTPSTGVAPSVLQEVGTAITTIPAGFVVNKKIQRQLEDKKKIFTSGEGVDWGTAEALAFGSLLVEGHGIRLSGQDVGRGTFSHRHAVLTDQNTNTAFVPLNTIRAKQATIEVHNSPLSEYAVMGFDYGYSLATPNNLTLWEGQFGDFANGAQIMIDQYIASAESKWLKLSGLVLLLPHGYEGQGPEHSSARLERFLQLCAEDNMAVIYPSTPANYFHALRRQLKRNFRKPLVVMTPKSLLRLRACVSAMADMAAGTSFQTVIPDATPLVAGGKVKRVVICSGKLYYDLLAAREEKKIDNVALVRLEQFYPFPAARLAEVLKPYSKAEVIWAQEEPENMGAWQFVDRRLEAVLVELAGASKRPLYLGRPAAASPAVGYLSRHTKEQDAIIKACLSV